jgi:uncharacterized protein
MENGLNIDKSPPLSEVMETYRLSRRSFLGGAAVLAGSLAFASSLKAGTVLGGALTKAGQGANITALSFKEIAKRSSPTHGLAEHYRMDIVLRWGDPLHDAIPFDPTALSEAAQQRQFGYNNDFIAYLPITRGGSESDHGLLCVNHEYTNRALMFSGVTRETEKTHTDISTDYAKIEMQAHGASVVEVKRGDAGWEYVIGSPYNRRITATTPMRFSGAAAGHADLRTSYDTEGLHPRGMIGNCSGGVTPWGTVLTCEENFDYYFEGEIADSHKAMYARYQVGTETWYDWSRTDPRFDLGKEPNEPNRFGWVVEYDPYDPTFTPIKRTALGRFKHEAANTVMNHDGRLVIYSGDDEPFEYVYRFVTQGKVTLGNPAANRNLLDSGVLSVARFDADGTMEWLPLVYGERGLTPENGFHSQAEVLIFARKAADLLGATPMDRSEDVEPNPVTGSVFMSLTKNADRVITNAANRRAHNKYGHIIEMIPPVNAGGHDHSATQFHWSIFLEGGNPAVSEHHAYYQSPPSEQGWLTNPDNVAFDGMGRIWIATDGQPTAVGLCDGLYAAQCEGAEKGAPKLFFTAPVGAEVTGPRFTPDSKTLFLSVQHPAEGSSRDAPATLWPDFKEGMPPRPSVVAFTHEKGRVIGAG